MQRLPWQPKNSHDNHPSDSEGLGTLVVAGGQGPVLLAASEQVLDQMTTAVGGTIEGAGAVFRAELRDGVADATSTQAGAGAAARVPFVARDAARPDPWSATPASADGALAQQRLEEGRLVLLPRREDDGQRLALSRGLEVHLGRAAALALAERLGRWRPPLAPAACWWARITLPSTNWTLQSTAPTVSACRWTTAKIRSQIPASRQRQKRL